jgi:hypothetical protein
MMTYTQKIDVLDLLIKILKEHEKKLDILAGRFEAVVYSAESVNTYPVRPSPREPEPKKPKQMSLSEQDLMRRFYTDI